MQVRLAREDEYAAVGDLCVAAYWAGGGMVAGDSERYETVLRAVPDRAQHGPVLVAVRDGHLVGTVTLTPPGTPYAEIARDGEMEFRFLAVDPAHWGSGVGEALTRACLEHARGQQARAMCLCVLDGNTTAARVYERLGFMRDPERDYRPAPPVLLRAYRLEL